MIKNSGGLMGKLSIKSSISRMMFSFQIQNSSKTSLGSKWVHKHK